MSQIDVPHVIPLSGLSINDLIILIKRNPELASVQWSLVFYAAENCIIEASYRSSESPQAKYALKTNGTMREVEKWMEEAQDYHRTILLRIPTHQIDGTIGVLKSVV